MTAIVVDELLDWFVRQNLRCLDASRQIALYCNSMSSVT